MRWRVREDGDGCSAWRLFPALILLIGLLFVPESPRWYMSRSMKDKAREVLFRMHTPAMAESELAEIEASLNQQEGDWKELLSPRLRRAMIIGIGLAVFQQFTGINTVIYYAPTIFQFAGLRSHSAAILATAGVGIVNVLFTIVAVRLLDRVGRRPLLLYGLVGMILSLGVLGFAFISPNLAQALAWISLICVMLYVAFFAISLGTGVLADDFGNLSAENSRTCDGHCHGHELGVELACRADLSQSASVFRASVDVLALCLGRRARLDLRLPLGP